MEWIDGICSKKKLNLVGIDFQSPLQWGSVDLLLLNIHALKKIQIPVQYLVLLPRYHTRQMLENPTLTNELYRNAPKHKMEEWIQSFHQNQVEEMKFGKDDVKDLSRIWKLVLAQEHQMYKPMYSYRWSRSMDWIMARTERLLCWP